MDYYGGLSESAQVWTERGLVPLRELAHGTWNVMLHGPGGTTFSPARLEPLGLQATVALTIGRRTTKTIVTSADHMWLVRGRSSEARTDHHPVPAECLLPGQRLLTVRPRSRLGKVSPSPFGVAAGIVFGDGCRPTSRDAAEVTLHGRKRELLKYFTGCQTRVTADGSVTVSGLPGSFKDRMAITEGTAALYGWLAGYVATDGSVSKNGQVALSSARREHLDWARTVATRLGIAAGDITNGRRIGINQTHPTNIFTTRLLAPPLDLLVRADQRCRWRPPGTAPSWTVRAVTPGPLAPMWGVMAERGGDLVLDGYVVVSTGLQDYGS